MLLRRWQRQSHANSGALSGLGFQFPATPHSRQAFWNVSQPMTGIAGGGEIKPTAVVNDVDFQKLVLGAQMKLDFRGLGMLHDVM